MYTKSLITQNFGLEDTLIFLAWLCSFPYMAVCIVASVHGASTHQWNVQIFKLFVVARVSSMVERKQPHCTLEPSGMNHGYGPVLKHNYPTHEINGLTTATVRKLCRDNLRPPDLLNKASILLQYLKIFVPQGRYRSPMLYAIHITLWLTISFYFAIMVVEIFACTPREKIWNPLVVGRCVHPTAILIAAASSNVATDFAILVLPMYTLLHLQMPRKRKLGILAGFATGAL